MIALTHWDGAAAQSFEEALSKADLVVIAHVTKTAFKLNPGETAPVNTMPLADETLAVDRTLKGEAPKELTLHQSGGPMPQGGGIIGIVKGDPVLFPGDRVLLLALKQKDGSGYGSTYPLGKYYIRDGTVAVPDGNPCNWLDGLSEANVIKLVQTSLSSYRDDLPPAHNCDWSRF